MPVGEHGGAAGVLPTSLRSGFGKPTGFMCAVQPAATKSSSAITTFEIERQIGIDPLRRFGCTLSANGAHRGECCVAAFIERRSQMPCSSPCMEAGCPGRVQSSQGTGMGTQAMLGGPGLRGLGRRIMQTVRGGRTEVNGRSVLAAWGEGAAGRRWFRQHGRAA